MENPKWKKKALGIPQMQLEMLPFDFMSMHSKRHDLGYYFPLQYAISIVQNDSVQAIFNCAEIVVFIVKMVGH